MKPVIRPTIAIPSKPVYIAATPILPTQPIPTSVLPLTISSISIPQVVAPVAKSNNIYGTSN